MRRTLTPALSLIIGLITAQVLFTGFVYSSNNHLHQNLLAMKAAGYSLLVPNALVIPTLRQWTPAFCGGLFFTLTVGAGLALIGWLAVFLWRVLPKYRRIIFTVFLALGAYVVFRLNLHGLNFRVTAICLIIPALAGLTARACYGNRPASPGFFMFALHVSVFNVLLCFAVAWIPDMKADLFITIRDHVLLTHSLGRNINDFYYQYTLYPAEAFKSLDQKLLKTITLSVPDKSLYPRIENRFLDADYLPVNAGSADLKVTLENNRLIFDANGRTVHSATVSDFVNQPFDTLETVSDSVDRQAFFRTMTFISLMAASPLLCYVLLHAFFTLLLFPVPAVNIRSGIAGVLCAAAFIGGILSLSNAAAGPSEAGLAGRYLHSENWRDRVNVLRQMAEEDLPFSVPDDAFERLQSPLIAERYWLAKAAGQGGGLRSKQIALALVEDDHPNVACMALYSLGKQGDPSVIPLITRHIEETDHWYVQWYGYKSLKRLGWHQPSPWRPF